MNLNYLKLAYQLALRGKGTTSPNPMVGAVLVKNGKIIAQGWHKRTGGPHAEIMALKQAGAKARGAKLYVTLEPCFHFGRTPPCVDAIVRSGIQEVWRNCSRIPTGSLGYNWPVSRLGDVYRTGCGATQRGIDARESASNDFQQ